jgi:hypothetical protein
MPRFFFFFFEFCHTNSPIPTTARSGFAQYRWILIARNRRIVNPGHRENQSRRHRPGAGAVPGPPNTIRNLEDVFFWFFFFFSFQLTHRVYPPNLFCSFLHLQFRAGVSLQLQPGRFHSRGAPGHRSSRGRCDGAAGRGDYCLRGAADRAPRPGGTARPDAGPLARGGRGRRPGPCRGGRWCVQIDSMRGCAFFVCVLFKKNCNCAHFIYLFIYFSPSPPSRSFQP